MFFVNWFWDVLGYFGLSRGEGGGGCICRGGLGGNAHSEELIVGKIRFKTFDLGGHETARRIWRDYFAAVDAIVFMVDATDRGRFQEAKEELTRKPVPGVRPVELFMCSVIKRMGYADVLAAAAAGAASTATAAAAVAAAGAATTAAAAAEYLHASDST
ncbi:small GTP-binding protein sar1, putative [Eimeria praecox]|uniref:Small GTP-binding protein sar1, putative n=1 Tax=Eimeria praecox TaxID=51316 RepID=U6G6Z2_9EIME|nr:small GTP-binding protein sar1, putative [Eimeria praecox]